MRSTFIFLTCLFSLAFLSSAGFADSIYVWSDAQGDGLWSTGANWASSPGGSPRTNPQPTDSMYLLVPEDLSTSYCEFAENATDTITHVETGGYITYGENGSVDTPMTLDIRGTMKLPSPGQLLVRSGAYWYQGSGLYGSSVLNIWGSINDPLTVSSPGSMQVRGGVYNEFEDNSGDNHEIQGIVNQYSGSVVALNSLSVWGGVYNLVDGNFTSDTVTFDFDLITKRGAFNQEGGHAETHYLGLFFGGAFNLTGGTLKVTPGPSGSYPNEVWMQSGDFTQTGGNLESEVLFYIPQYSTATFSGGDTSVGSIFLGDDASLIIGPQETDRVISVTDCLSHRNLSPGVSLNFSGGDYEVLADTCTFLFSRGSGQYILHIDTDTVNPSTLALDKTVFQFDKGFTDPILDAFALDLDYSLQDIYEWYPAEHYVLGGLIVGASDATNAMPLLLEGDPGTAFYVADLQIRNRGYITYLKDENGADIVIPLYFIDDTGNPQQFFPGDANLDGTVSFSDYLTLEQNFGGTGKTWAQGDFNGDGHVSFADYTILEQNFGKHYQGQRAENRSNAQSSEPRSLPALTDLNGDGKIDDEDMLLLFQQIDGQGQD